MQLYEIKKSKFYSQVFEIHSKLEVNQIITKLRKEHKKARHLCYAFYFQDQDGNFQSGVSDDGEPKGTAGQPLFKTLMTHQQINKLIVVIRYFGGIKLGAGGLLRAYLKAANLNFEKEK